VCEHHLQNPPDLPCSHCTPPHVYWGCGSKEEMLCQICNASVKGEFYDAKHKTGPWAIMCKPCHRLEGVGYGVGLGQLYKRQADGRWLQIKGGTHT